MARTPMKFSKPPSLSETTVSLSAAFATPQTGEDFVYPVFGFGLLDELVVGLARGYYPWHDEVEVESPDQPQALGVPLPVADAVEHRRPLSAPNEEDRVSGEQGVMLPRVPQEGSRPGRVSRCGDDLEVLAHVMTLREGLIHELQISEAACASASWM